MKIYFNNEKIFSNSQKAITLAKTRKIGEIKKEIVTYSPYEALYLIENKKANAIKNEKKLSYKEILKKLCRGKEFYIKYLVFKELKEKGYIIKTGLKFGEEFRVYKKNEKHAKWIVYPIHYSKKLDLREFIAKNRIAHSTAKRILLAIIDSEEKIIFYEIQWIKP